MYKIIIYVKWKVKKEYIERAYCGKNADTRKRHKLLVRAIDNKVNGNV